MYGFLEAAPWFASCYYCCDIIKCRNRLDDKTLRKKWSDVEIHLNIQSNECLRYPKHNSQHDTLPYSHTKGQFQGSGKFSTSSKQVLHSGKEGNVNGNTEEETRSTEFTPTTDYFEYFRFDFPFEWGVEFVPAKKIEDED